MDTLNIKIKRISQNKGLLPLPLPAYGSKGSSGMDLRADIEDSMTLNPGEIKLIPTGLCISIPSGYEAQIRPRSGLALKHGIGMVNSPGTIDSDYRGEIGIIMINWGKDPFLIKRSDRIAQMVICKVYNVELMQVEELDDTSRSSGGFGHTGVV